MTVPIILNTCNVCGKAARNLTNTVYIDGCATLIVNQVFLLRVIVGPDALRGLDLEHLTLLALVLVLGLRPILINFWSAFGRTLIHHANLKNILYLLSSV